MKIHKKNKNEEEQSGAGGVTEVKRKGVGLEIDAKLDAMGLGSSISAPELTPPPQFPIDWMQYFSAALRLLRSRRLCDCVSLLPWQGSSLRSVEPLHFRAKLALAPLLAWFFISPEAGLGRRGSGRIDFHLPK